MPEQYLTYMYSPCHKYSVAECWSNQIHLCCGLLYLIPAWHKLKTVCLGDFVVQISLVPDQRFGRTCVLSTTYDTVTICRESMTQNLPALSMTSPNAIALH